MKQLLLIYRNFSMFFQQNRAFWDFWQATVFFTTKNCVSCVLTNQDTMIHIQKNSILKPNNSLWYNQWRTQKIFMGGVLVQGHMVVICIWCALFVTSQFDVMSMFPNQRFGEVCWQNNAYFFYTHSPYFMWHCTECKLSALQVRLSEEINSMPRHSSS